MSSDRWRRLDEIFQQAVDRPAGEREAFLQEACGDDPALRRAVESLLEADGASDAFLEQPLIPQPPDSGTPLPDGGQLGAYRLLREIGQGGMSTVYLGARGDDSFRRRVAIKVIRQGMESEESHRRFRAERQILASLDHPWIAKLFDGGETASGLPYLVMEYVAGLPIDLYCDHHRLTVGERTDLFVKVCSAVHYAHQNLVVHRDLKPSNILVTSDGSPKLLDFGIAKLLNPELSAAEIQPTATWMRLLTPHYASPEQIRGEVITTASDVYSLGVLLYKLLTGQLPYALEARTLKEVERLLTHYDPPRPSTVVSGNGSGSRREPGDEPTPESISRARGVRPRQLARQLGGDLDNVVLMAMRSTPQRRYSSVEQLAEDLRRHRMGFPVIARQGNLSYRLGKFLRRNRLAIAGAAVVLLLVLSFAVATTLQSARVARERDQARRERDEKEQVVALVEEVFQLADPGQTGGETFTVREALDRSAGLIGQRLGKVPALEAALRQTIGRIYFNLGLFSEAQIHLEKVVGIHRQLYGADSLEYADSLAALGAVFRETGDYDRAEELTTEALAKVRALVGNDHPGLIRPLNHLVTLFCYRSDYERAREPSLEALTLAREYLDDTQADLAEAVTNRAVVLKKNGDLEGAKLLYQKGLAIQQRILGNDHPEVADILNNLAVVLKALGDLDGAEQMHRRTLALRRRLYGDSHPVVAQSLTNLAAVERDRGRYQLAETDYRKALAILGATVGPSHPLTIQVSVTLGSLLVESGRPQAAVEWLREGLERWRADLPPEDGLVAWSENGLGEALTALGRLEEARELLESSLARIEEIYGADHPKTRLARERLAANREAREGLEAASRHH
jgi:eukaryotic-like serine/threonine-protein kinase